MILAWACPLILRDLYENWTVNQHKSDTQILAMLADYSRHMADNKLTGHAER